MDEKPAHDPVNHPSHYTNGDIECIDAIEAALGPQGFIAYCRGNVIKYTWRTGSKDAAHQDIGKAKWYANRAESTIRKFIESAEAIEHSDLPF